MQATKTPKFLMSPNTNSNHHSTYQSIKGMDDDLFDLPNQHRNTVGSQTSDEIYKVINDFHLKNHRIIPKESEGGTEDYRGETSDSDRVHKITDSEWYAHRLG